MNNDIKSILRVWVDRVRESRSWTLSRIADEIGVAERTLTNALQKTDSRNLIRWEAAKALAELAEANQPEWLDFQIELARWRVARPARHTRLTSGIFEILERLVPDKKALVEELSGLIEDPDSKEARY